MHNIWLARLGKLLVAVAAGWLLLRWIEWRNLYCPTSAITETPKTYGVEFEDVEFVAEDGARLYGWWVPCANARGTIIHCHGNGGNIGHRAWMAADFHRLGLNAFIFDYRGYGRSRGIPTEEGTYRDARAAYEVVRARYGQAEDPPVILHGQSLGGAVAIHLALDKPVRGLIVESSFTSVPDMAAKYYPWLPRRLIRFKYDALARVGQLAIPKLFAHSPDDEIVPFPLGQRLFQAAAGPKSFVALSGGHNDSGWTSTPEYWRAINHLVDQALGPMVEKNAK